MRNRDSAAKPGSACFHIATQGVSLGLIDWINESPLPIGDPGGWGRSGAMSRPAVAGVSGS